MEWGFKAWEAKPLAPAGKLVGEARVQLGFSADVGLITQNAVAYSVPTGQSGTPPKCRLSIKARSRPRLPRASMLPIW